MSDDKELYDFSRRKLLAGLGTIGAASAGAGLGTSALLWDEETFGSANNPNVLQAGTLNLKVDWKGVYYNDKGGQTIDSPTGDANNTAELVDGQTGPIVNLTDVKPGDVMELTLSAHVFGNPAFLGVFYQEHDDSDSGFTEPEDMVDDSMDDADGTSGGDLDDHMNVVIWHDDGDNIPEEVWTGNTTLDSNNDGTLDNEAAYVDEVGSAGSPSDIVNTGSPQVVASGTLNSLDPSDMTLDAGNAVVQGQDGDAVANDFPESMCYQNSITEYIGILAWVPRDIPGVDDNLIQGDEATFSFGFDAIQCRHNIENGEPIDDDIQEADGDAGPQIVLENQTADVDPTDDDDFPVPDSHIVSLSRVKFLEDTGTIALPVANTDGEAGVSSDDTFWYEATNNAPAFVVGLHSPDVGNGDPGSLSSLIGVRPLQPGDYSNVKVPVWAGPPKWQQKLWQKKGLTGDYPSPGELVEVDATIWYGPDVFPPIVPRDSQDVIAQTPNDERNGPVRRRDGSLVSSSADVGFPE